MRANDIVVDCTTLYVGPYQYGVVTAISLADGSQRTLNPIAGGALAIDATRVYSVSQYDGLVIACPKTGCGSGYTTLATGQTAAGGGLAVADTSVYWTSLGAPGGVAVLKAPLAGGAPVTLVANGSATAMAVGGGRVFYTTVTPGMSGQLMSVPVAGGTPSVLVGPQQGFSVQNVSTDADNVYFSGNDGIVGQMPLAGGAIVTLATAQWNGPSTIATDGQYVYWGAGGNLVKTPIGGGQLTTLASGQPLINSVAVDADNVYWASFGPGTVMMRAK
jgi:hypothetical protein